MYDINTISELVDALGGDTRLGADLGITQEAVGNWKLRGHIPPGWHVRLIARVHARGKSVAPSVFHLTEDDVPPGFFRPAAPVDRLTA